MKSGEAVSLLTDLNKIGDNLDGKNKRIAELEEMLKVNRGLAEDVSGKLFELDERHLILQKKYHEKDLILRRAVSVIMTRGMSCRTVAEESIITDYEKHYRTEEPLK